MTMETRSLMDDDGTYPSEESVLNPFDNTFEVADGFRPAQDDDREGGDREDLPSSYTRPTSDLYATTPIAGPSRNSTRKSRSHENPFASPEDRDAEPLLHQTDTPSTNTAFLTHRSVSSASSNHFARTNSVGLNGSGPSHPYGMYPQGTLARTASVATASTGRPQPHSTPRNGPQHPYALYPQGIGDDLDNDDETVQDSVPIGFTGLGQTYLRQRGPDGEEQDIVGYYGHAEQLPPYSRYPDDGPEKQPLLPAPEPPTASHTRAPVQGTDPSMPLMHAQIEPAPQQQQQSMTDESELTRQPSNQSRTNASERGNSMSSEDSVASKKSWNEKTWKERRKTRVCGVRCWWYMVAIGVVIFILIVTSGAVGGFYAGQEKAKQSLNNRIQTTGWDASAISTPTSIPPLPTGTYSLALGPPHETQAACLNLSQQKPAWDCNLAYGDEVAIHVSTPNGGNQSGAYIYYVNNKNENDILTYGSQTSQMVTSFSPFTWVQDPDNPDLGPALYFRAEYDKLVVIPEEALDLGTKKIKRDVPQSWYETETAGPSARPWKCFWNNTLLEGFIYVNEQIRALPSSLSVTPTVPYSTPAWTATMTALPSQTITTTLTMSSTTATFTGPASKLPKWLYDNYPMFNMTKYASENPPEVKRDDDEKDSDDEYGDLKLYPYRIKMEERRMPGSPLPYCIQYQVLNDGLVNWIPNQEGQQIVVQLTERNPPFRPILYPDEGGKKRAVEKRADFPGTCHCQWMSGFQ